MRRLTEIRHLDHPTRLDSANGLRTCLVIGETADCLTYLTLSFHPGMVASRRV